MHTYWSSLVLELAPGITAVTAGILAALPGQSILRQSRRGRARSAIAYLAGLLAGFATTVLLVLTVGKSADSSAVLGGGLLGAFFGPFVGMARAKWLGPAKTPRPRNTEMVRGLSR